MVPISPFKTFKRFMFFTAMTGLELGVILKIPYFAEFLPRDVPFVRRAGAVLLLIVFPLHVTQVLLFNVMVLRADRRSKAADRSTARPGSESALPSD